MVHSNKSLDRDFGDCEIHSLSFMNNSVYIKIFDPRDTSYFTMIFHEMNYLNFATTHSQNVIESMIIFDTPEKAKESVCVRDLLAKMDPATMSRLFSEPQKVAYFQPISGGETLVFFKEFELQ
ncbi:hypothetical protein SAMN05444161_4582 [Rhizobiales bacterium GAS191]|nr:hypothetical protein SAMN05444161_4582 [Rhizobiales bacterium GAS191]